MADNPITSPADFYDVFADVTGGDLEAWRRAAEFGAAARDRVNAAWETADYPLDLVREAAAAGLMTDGIEIPGQPSYSALGRSLIVMEVARCDASLSTAIAVQAGLAMRSIANCGSEEQKATWLPAMATCDKLGAFALTEPDHGSDSVALETSARREGDEWVINGAKKWIGHGSVGDVSIIWARTDDGEVGGFLVDQTAEGYSAETINGKGSLRGISQALITLTDVRVPDSARLPGARSFRDTAGVLTGTRCSVAWAALGIALDCFEKALAHVQEREQFGRELAGFQIIQQRLSDMLQDLVAMALYCRRLADLEEAGTLSPKQASLAKVHNTRAARRIAANARDMLGGVGILLDNHVMRHMADLEALHTYEGTDTIQSLIVGKALTGVSAYR